MITQLAKEIIKKRELQTLDLVFIEKRIHKELNNNPKIRKKFEVATDIEKFKKTAAYKELLKLVRTHLREIYGVFQNEPTTQQKLITTLLQTNDEQTIKRTIIDLLQTHQSTKERFIHYPLLYKKIKELVPHVNKVFDIGCGINPLSYIYFKKKPEVYATDIATIDMQNMQKILNKMQIKNTCFAADITKLTKEEIQHKTNNTQFDLCLMFKLLDTLESNEKYASIKLLQKIHTKYFLLSFPKFSLGGKRDIGKTKHAWVEKLINKLPQLSIINEFETPNEIFYLLEQHDIVQSQ